MGDPRQRGSAKEFKREAVRPLSTSGRVVGEVAANLRVGKSRLAHWRWRFQEAALLPGPHPDAEKATAAISRPCNVLGASAGGYYAWKARIASRRQREDPILLAHTRGHFTCSNETYGSPRMHIELKAQGLSIGVARLMRSNGLRVMQRRRSKRTTDSQHNNPVAAKLLKQDFTAMGPNQKWGSDIS